MGMMDNIIPDTMVTGQVILHSFNKHLGTQEELQELIDALHARGMKLMVDVVLNHAGYSTEDIF